VPHARALAAFGGAVAVELCTPSGMRTVLVGEDGAPIERERAGPHCELCQAPAAIVPEASVANGPATAPVADAAPPGRAGLPPFPPRAPPQQPRAPPAA